MQKMTEPKIITSKQENPDLEIGLKEIIGKRVLAENGEVVGKVKDLVLKNNKLIGLLIKKGNIKYFVDYDFIKDMYSKSVFLKINPVIRYLGMVVFDEEGTKLGKVIEINQSSSGNSLKSIVVKKKMFGKKKTINFDKVEISKKNIILKI